MSKKKEKKSHAANLIKKHFSCAALSDLVTARRTFPSTTRADVQRSLEETFTKTYPAAPVGLHRNYDFAPVTLSTFMETNHNPVVVGPLEYEEIDVGDAAPVRCLKRGLWISCYKNLPFAVILDYYENHGGLQSISVEVALRPGQEGATFASGLLSDLEKLVYQSSSYRGKVISLEAVSNYSGHAGVIKVHKLNAVEREQVILPAATLQLLERNIMQFVEQREPLRKLGMALKKGILLYGKPGTGKTHTIQYLASQLPGHTTLLITAAQVGLLAEYFLLARFLQPAMLVIEDVDLIGRDRNSMNNVCTESTLNQLLNEMDGLNEDAAMLFVLTTNRPEQLEAALSSRPGRIDQAIEFPLPDSDGRRKLITLYSHNLPMDEVILEDLVSRTDQATPAFIKELMRRSAQYYLQADGTDSLKSEHVELALNDMLFAGGKLNINLLGGAIQLNEPAAV